MGTDYSLNKSRDHLEKRFDARFDQNFEKVYHVSAFENRSMPVITDEKPHRFSYFDWGLVPHWVKDRERVEDIRDKTVNARADTIFDKPSFKFPIRERRCLIVMDGYFEWREANGETYPYYIHKKANDSFACAGIWDEWSDDRSKEKIRTFSMISIDANPFIEKVNNKKKRMPVILPRKDERDWIRSDIGKEQIKSMLKTYEGDDLTAYPVKHLIDKKDVDPDVPEVLERQEYDGLVGLDEEVDQDGSKQSRLF